MGAGTVTPVPFRQAAIMVGKSNNLKRVHTRPSPRSDTKARRVYALVGVALGVAAIGSIAWLASPYYRGGPEQGEEYADQLAARTEPDPAWTPAVPIPDRLEELPPVLVKLIQEHVEAVRSTPRDAKAHATLGLVYEANNLWTQARTCYQNAYRLQPEEPMWVHHAAIAAKMWGDLEAGLVILQEAAAKFPDFVPIHFRLGDALLETGAIHEAEAAFGTVIERAPSRCEGYVGLADAKLRQGRNAEAASLLERAIQIDPYYKTARYLLGLAYRDLGRREEARKQLELGINSQKRYMGDAWSTRRADYNLALSSTLARSDRLLDERNVDEAIEILEGLWALHRDDVRVMNQLAAAYLLASRLEEARNVLLSAAQVDEANVGIHINLTHCYLGLDSLDEALQAADRAVALGPEMWEAHYNRSLVLKTLKRYEPAYDALRTVVRLKAQSATVYNAIGQVCAVLQKYAEAKEYYQLATKRNPGSARAYLGLCRSCIQLKEWDEATTALEAARTIDPNDPAVDVLAGQLAERKGESE